MSKKALIFGGYGNFGKLISRAFIKSSIPVILAGRKESQLAEVQKNLIKQFPKAQIEIAVRDINDDQVDYLKKTKPKVLINTCGPFQTANYKIVENCILTKTNYIDLADGRDFVTKMKEYHGRALRSHTTVIPGASSVPGLSSAVLEEYKDEFKEIDKVWYGISPGQRTTRGGIATVKGVLSYIGKPIRPFGNLEKPIYGWQDTYSEKYPGGIGKRLFSNCQVPDLDLFPDRYKIKDLRFSAGTESKLLHRLMVLTSWIVRMGLPIKLQKFSGALLKFSHAGFDWLGTDAGGMHMTLVGTDLEGKKIQRKWYIIIKKGHGPNVPAIPAIVLGKKICQDKFQMPGVHPCVGLVSLNEYLDGLKQYDVQVFTQKKYL